MFIRQGATQLNKSVALALRVLVTALSALVSAVSFALTRLFSVIAIAL